jgi:hypothetical protein
MFRPMIRLVQQLYHQSSTADRPARISQSERHCVRKGRTSPKCKADYRNIRCLRKNFELLKTFTVYNPTKEYMLLPRLALLPIVVPTKGGIGMRTPLKIWKPWY